MYLAWQPTRRPAPQRAGIGAFVPARYTPGTRQLHRRRRCQPCDSSHPVTPNSSSKTAASPHGCPGPSNPAGERSGQPHPLCPPGKVSRSPGPLPQSSAHRPPGRPRSGKTRGPPGGHTGCTPDSAARVKPEHAADAARPSVRGRPWKTGGYTDRPAARALSAMRPWMPQHSAQQRDKVTHHGTEKNGPLAREFAASGRFCRWWQVLGSNQRRLSRRFYRPLSFYPSRTPLTSGYVPRGAVPGHRRPSCVRAPRDPGNSRGPRTGERAATDGGAGAATLTVRPPVPLPCSPFRGEAHVQSIQ
jgi:hypothetical protein